MHLPTSPYLQLLKNRLDLTNIPFSDRGSRLLVYRDRTRPDALYVKLAERLTAVSPGLSVYRNRPPFIPLLQLVDGEGVPQPFDITTYPHAVVFETPIGQFVLAFQDRETLSFGLPAGIPCGIRFVVVPDIARPDGSGGEFKSLRNCAYSTNGQLLLNRISEKGSGYDVTLAVEAQPDNAITLHIRPSLDLSRNVHPFSTTIAAAEERWHRWMERAPAVDEQYRNQYYYAWWVMGNNLLSPLGHFTRESVAPSKAHYVGAWQWDNYFHALAFRYTDAALAGDQIRFMLDHQLPDGMIPDAIYDEGAITHLEIPVAAAVTKPPIAAWVAMHTYDTTGDLSLIKDVYGPLVRNNSWWFGINDDDSDGIIQYSHPFSSGLDDSPLWDEGMPVEAVDINTYLCLQQEALAKMARLLGHDREALMWERKAQTLARRMVEHFYDADAGLFWFQKEHQRIDVLTPFSLYPLWTGKLDRAINDRLVAHLTNPASFWANHPLPTVALNDPKYDAAQMWRGPVWININYIFVEALQRSGYPKLAGDLAERTMRLVMGQNDIYEYYDPTTGLAPPKAAPMFGWSAACFIDLAIRTSRGELA
ncbi:MAG: hypothetical protein H7Y32_11870 [Chloroflexales bacterium]|nr:hypothetical protein [Chloroflexales bacterium]